MEKEELDEIWSLYFDKMYSYEQIEEHFKGKFSYNEIKDAIWKAYEPYIAKEKQKN